jgi:amidase
MNRFCRSAVQPICAGLLIASFFPACSIPFGTPASANRDHAFIDYWPPPKGSNELRLAVKDLIDMKGVVTTAGSKYIAKNYPPATRDAKCLEIARDRNVRIVGKTNLTEFAMTWSGVNAYFGTPKNPISRKHKLIPGGSSSGAAVAVASGMADISFGTDTAGSIRLPAACCGILGLKTTFGLVSLQGVYPISPEHLDTIGPMANDMPHLVQGMDLLQRGFSGQYERAVAARRPASGIRIGRLYVEGTDPAIDQALDDALAARHFRVVKLDDTFRAKWTQAQKEGRILALADAWRSDQNYIFKTGVQATTQSVIIPGKAAYDALYADALQKQKRWRRALRDVFRNVDFIALPTMQKTPPRLPFFGDSVLYELSVLAVQNTEAVNFAGNPALVLPVPIQGKDVPVTSLQLVGPPMSEAKLLATGQLLEISH